MSSCAIHDAGSIELYFYDELGPAERAAVGDHLRRCRQCRGALDELALIREALAARPDVSAPAAGDWSGFTARLDAAVRTATSPAVVAFQPRGAAARRPLAGLLATAALLAIVAASVFFASQARQRMVRPRAAPATEIATGAATDVPPVQAGLASISARHLERSKLVVLGLATREAGAAESAGDWAYERELASSLLNDTRLYRMAAEQRGLTSLAGVMQDLELVLLQTSMAEATDEAALPRIQRLIRKRGLVQKMDVGTTGLVP